MDDEMGVSTMKSIWVTGTVAVTLVTVLGVAPAIVSAQGAGAYARYAQHAHRYTNHQVVRSIHEIGVHIRPPLILFTPNHIDVTEYPGVKPGRRTLLLLEYNTHSGRYIDVSVSRPFTAPLSMGAGVGVTTMPVMLRGGLRALYSAKPGAQNTLVWVQNKVRYALVAGTYHGTNWGMFALSRHSYPYLTRSQLIDAAESVLR